MGDFEPQAVCELAMPIPEVGGATPFLRSCHIWEIPILKAHA